MRGRSGHMPAWPDVKICGVCDPSDAAESVASGATHVGVIRIPMSRRMRPLGVVRGVCAAAAGARRVGVYSDATLATILREVEALGLDVVQLHGNEGPDRVEALVARGVEVWKTVRPRWAEDLLESARRYSCADLLLVEGRSALGRMGAGVRFRWAEIAAALERLPPGTLVGVSGGLNPENVGHAVRRFRPAVVDANAGVEAEVGRKDPLRVAEFIRRAGSSGSWGRLTEDGLA
jgi:phosphoribosylanthranilate isomerase